MRKLHELAPFAIYILFAFRYGILRTVLVHLFVEFNSHLWTRLYHYYVAKRDPAACPALFLYSKADELVTYDAVEGVIKQREVAIGNVSKKCWETSAHVRHVYEFEDEYVEELRKFGSSIGMSS